MADDKIMLPRIGAHISIWGSGHTCDKPFRPHGGACVCECEAVQPYDAGLTTEGTWQYGGEHAVPQDS